MDGFEGWNEMKENEGRVWEKGDGMRFRTDVPDEPEMETNVRLFHRWWKNATFYSFVFNPYQLFLAPFFSFSLSSRNCSNCSAH